MEPPSLPELWETLNTLEARVGQAECRLEELRQQIRSAKIEADAAEAPGQPHRLPSRQHLWTSARVAALFGFPMGLFAGSVWFAMISAFLDWG